LPAAGFGNVGIAAAARTGHNARMARHRIGIAGPAGLSGKA
jgi:hypothetical protein